jgi:hypothetical protein
MSGFVDGAVIDEVAQFYSIDLCSTFEPMPIVNFLSLLHLYGRVIMTTIMKTHPSIYGMKSSQSCRYCIASMFSSLMANAALLYSPPSPSDFHWELTCFNWNTASTTQKTDIERQLHSTEAGNDKLY